MFGFGKKKGRCGVCQLQTECPLNDRNGAGCSFHYPEDGPPPRDRDAVMRQINRTYQEQQEISRQGKKNWWEG